MRLTKEQVCIIKTTIIKYISDAKIILFGSRVDDNKKGGDIDLFVETNQNITLKNEISILTELELGGILRKVDLLIKTPYKKEQNIYKTIYQQGIIL